MKVTYFTTELQDVMARLALAAISPRALTMPLTAAPHSALALGRTPQEETALDSHVAALPTISARVSEFTAQENSPTSLRGSGHVCTMASLVAQEPYYNKGTPFFWLATL